MSTRRRHSVKTKLRVVKEALETDNGAIVFDNSYDIKTNAGSDFTKTTFPRRLNTEVFSFTVLEKAFNNCIIVS